ncbi:MAG: hypothetical protein JWN14_1047, partial [Chthonomonadales bacterium]|nr:hypothetical protein [Chthonomonadales bacterium]
RQTLALDSTTQAMSAVRLGSMRIPLTVPAGKRLVGFRTDVRGFAAKSGASRIVLVVDLGGVTKTVEYGYGKPHNGAFTFSAASASPLQGKKGRKRTPVPIKGLRATGITNYVATILFSLQRTDASAQATLAIDSLDVVPILH